MDALRNRLKLARKRAELSQEALARRLDVSKQTVSNWETGRFLPRAGEVEKIASALGINASWLLGGLDAPSAPATPPEAWQHFLKTPLGQGCSQAQLAILRSVQWPPDIQPTVSLYMSWAAALQGIEFEEAVSEVADMNRKLRRAIGKPE